MGWSGRDAGFSRDFAASMSAFRSPAPISCRDAVLSICFAASRTVLTVVRIFSVSEAGFSGIDKNAYSCNKYVVRLGISC